MFNYDKSLSDGQQRLYKNEQRHFECVPKENTAEVSNGGKHVIPQTDHMEAD